MTDPLRNLQLPFGVPPADAQAVGLSLRQPWVHLHLNEGKDIENRSWNTHYRGPVFIHAARTMSLDNIEEAVQAWCAVKGKSPHDLDLRMPLSELPRGGFIARTRIVHVYPPCGAKGSRCNCGAGPWHFPHRYGFKLDAVQPLRELVPFRGVLGLFKIPPDIAAQLVAP